MTDKRRWVVTGVSDETRRAVVAYAELQGLTIGEVLEMELQAVRDRMSLAIEYRARVAEVEGGRRKAASW